MDGAYALCFPSNVKTRLYYPKINPTTLDAQNQGRVLLILGDINVAVEGLRITGGNANFGGGIATGIATVTLKNNQIFSNTATGSAGGLYLESQTGADIVSDNTFTYNTSGNCGGGLSLNTTAATIRNNIIIFNEAKFGGGICSGGNPSTYSANNIRGNTIASNTVATHGGGIYLLLSDDIVSDNIVVSNVADEGGGIALMYRGNAKLINNVVTDNQANTGSGMYIQRFAPCLVHNTVAHNNKGDSIGIYIAEDSLEDSTVVLTNTILSDQAVGISVTAGSTVTVNGVLWYSNGHNYSGPGAIAVTNAHTGNPAFAADGYHLTPGSAAIDAGVDGGIENDIDGDPRPIGPPDLGADEWSIKVYLPLVLQNY